MGYRYGRGWADDCDWDDEPAPEEGDEVQTLYRVTRHTARRDHADGRVKKGDRYRRIVTGGYKVGGPRWMNVNKIVTKPAAEVAA
jgi:hypothetical protein